MRKVPAIVWTRSTTRIQHIIEARPCGLSKWFWRGILQALPVDSTVIRVKEAREFRPLSLITPLTRSMKHGENAGSSGPRHHTDLSHGTQIRLKTRRIIWAKTSHWSLWRQTKQSKTRSSRTCSLPKKMLQLGANKSHVNIARLKTELESLG